MTSQRVLPAVSLPVPGRPHANEEATLRPRLLPLPPPAHERGARPAGARPASVRTARKEGLLTTPARAGMLIGAAAAIYAVSLATVSGLQAQSQADLAARRQPMLDAIAQARVANDSLAATILAADARARALAAEYAAAGGDVTAYQAKLDQLSALVAKVKGSAAALSTKINLPTVSMHGAIGGGYVSSARSAPATGGTTAASGKP